MTHLLTYLLGIYTAFAIHNKSVFWFWTPLKRLLRYAIGGKKGLKYASDEIERMKINRE